MDEIIFAWYVNSHIAEDSDLPRVTLQRLRRWARLDLLLPPYSPQNLEQALKLLLLERAVGAARHPDTTREVAQGAAQ